MAKLYKLNSRKSERHRSESNLVSSGKTFYVLVCVQNRKNTTFSSFEPNSIVDLLLIFRFRQNDAIFLFLFFLVSLMEYRGYTS